MKPSRAVVATCLVCVGLLGAGASFSHAGGSADLEFTRAELLADGWSGLDSLDGLGLRVEWAPDSWPVRMTFGIQQLDKEDRFCPDLGVPCSELGPIKVEFTLVSLGIAYRPWADKPVHPRLGAGLTRIDTQGDMTGGLLQLEDQGDNLGYVEAGVEWSIAQRWHAAGAVRRTLGSASGGTNAQLGLDTLQYTLSVGYVW